MAFSQIKVRGWAILGLARVMLKNLFLCAALSTPILLSKAVAHSQSSSPGASAPQHHMQPVPRSRNNHPCFCCHTSPHSNSQIVRAKNKRERLVPPSEKSYAIVQSPIDATCCLDALRLVVTRPRTVDRSSKLFLFPHSPICNQLCHLILCQGRFALRRSATSRRRPSTRIGVGQDLQRCPFERARPSSHP